ncbi:hypothetical protein E2C01_074020 [Portunus trituberculatus]|uniref:Uncharacterized protein n=1 Tax=Portunus trituberculatus TaxID=210409 RepID=A0A5B7I6Y0_PORTR|nr:hypothetical protein [Portunus trituberculatus]
MLFSVLLSSLQRLNRSTPTTNTTTTALDVTFMWQKLMHIKRNFLFSPSLESVGQGRRAAVGGQLARVSAGRIFSWRCGLEACFI